MLMSMSVLIDIHIRAVTYWQCDLISHFVDRRRVVNATLAEFVIVTLSGRASYYACYITTLTGRSNLRSKTLRSRVSRSQDLLKNVEF